MDRHVFNTTSQNPGESVQAYVSTLKILAKKCDFGAISDELIRDRIVCGIESDYVRKQLLREKNLTLELAVSTCMLHEVREKLKGTKKRKHSVCKCVQFKSPTAAIAMANTPLSIVNAMHSINNATILEN